MLALHAVVLRWGRGAVGSAPRWHRGGRGFESHRLHQLFSQLSPDPSFQFRAGRLQPPGAPFAMLAADADHRLIRLARTTRLGTSFIAAADLWIFTAYARILSAPTLIDGLAQS